MPVAMARSHRPRWPVYRWGSYAKLSVYGQPLISTSQQVILSLWRCRYSCPLISAFYYLRIVEVMPLWRAAGQRQAWWLLRTPVSCCAQWRAAVGLGGVVGLMTLAPGVNPTSFQSLGA
jgi:hypothetical protein